MIGRCVSFTGACGGSFMTIVSRRLPLMHAECFTGPKSSVVIMVASFRRRPWFACGSVTGGKTVESTKRHFMDIDWLGTMCGAFEGYSVSYCTRHEGKPEGGVAGGVTMETQTQCGVFVTPLWQACAPPHIHRVAYFDVSACSINAVVFNSLTFPVTRHYCSVYSHAPFSVWLVTVCVYCDTEVKVDSQLPWKLTGSGSLVCGPPRPNVFWSRSDSILCWVIYFLTNFSARQNPMIWILKNTFFNHF